MMVVSDTSVLIDLFNPYLAGERRERLDLLIKTLELAGDRVMVPTPAYAEFLVKAESAKTEYYKRIESSKFFRIEPFSQRAAVQCADLLERAFSVKERRNVTKTKFKFDWMIVAAAKAHAASCIYFIDGDIGRYAKSAGVPAMHVDGLPLPKGTLPLFVNPPAAPPRA